MWSTLIFAIGAFGASSAAVLVNTTVSKDVAAVIVAPANPTPVIFNATVTNKTFIEAATTLAPTTTISPYAQLNVVDFFIKVIRGELIGARKCKHNHDCGAGLKCNALWNWCAPADTPEWLEYDNNCKTRADCKDLYYCSPLGKCKLAGPRPCRDSFDCAFDASANITFDCLDIEDLEKRAVVTQLGRPTAIKAADLKPRSKRHHHEHEVEIESDEVARFGTTAEGDHLMHGKRCWARCNADLDCGILHYPELILKENIACCNGYCTRKQSCVFVPQVFRATTAVPAFPLVKVKKF